jgi:hypothetical protein
MPMPMQRPGLPMGPGMPTAPMPPMPLAKAKSKAKKTTRRKKFATPADTEDYASKPGRRVVF